jgi:hypothetical protein
VSVSTEDYSEDRMALEVLTKAVQPKLMGAIANKATTKLAWDSLHLRNVGVERMHKARASTLRWEFDSLVLENRETADNFAVWMTHLTTQLAILTSSYTNEETIRWFLNELPSRFNQIIVSIETLLDLSDVSLDELIGRLKLVEEKMYRGEKESVAKLNLTEDELLARLSSRLKTTGIGSLESSKEAPSSSKRGRD